MSGDPIVRWSIVAISCTWSLLGRDWISLRASLFRRSTVPLSLRMTCLRVIVLAPSPALILQIKPPLEFVARIAALLELLERSWFLWPRPCPRSRCDLPLQISRQGNCWRNSKYSCDFEYIESLLAASFFQLESNRTWVLKKVISSCLHDASWSDGKFPSSYSWILASKNR